jgi:cytochrome P450
MRAAKDYPLIEPLLKRFIPKHLTSRRKAHNDMSEAKARRRRDMGSQRPDFLANMVDDVNIGVTEAEFTNTASALVLAGSETTATLLSGATFHLLINPDILAKLVEEVRSSFASDDEIDIVGVNKLTYMGACLDESLRIYPPVPQSFPRTVPEGGSTINGKWVHEKARLHSYFSCSLFWGPC